MSKQRRFTKAFETEAVRLAAMSGRTQREIAEDPGIGLSTLVRWTDQNRDRQINPASEDRQEDISQRVEASQAEERDSASGTGYPEEGDGFFLPGRGVDEFPVHQYGEIEVPRLSNMRCARWQGERLRQAKSPLCLTEIGVASRRRGEAPARDEPGGAGYEGRGYPGSKNFK